MSKICCRVNGRGNAWPIPIGEEHVFYNARNFQDLANASFSLIKYRGDEKKIEHVDWEILIDAGHGIPQFFIQNANRIPEAIFLTHPHIDHTIGLDWFVQSHYRKRKTRYPVYATRYCWQIAMQSYPHLEKMVAFHELLYDTTVHINDEIKVTAFPSYHGPFAFGASMLLFETSRVKILMTGDILLPVLRQKDFKKLQAVDLFITDANNRFPYPKCNHWSVDSDQRDSFDPAFLDNWLVDLTSTQMIIPHLQNDSEQKMIDYFNDWLNEFEMEKIPKSIFQFSRIIHPKEVWMVHYSGGEDEKYHASPKLTDTELEEWCKRNRSKELKGIDFQSPKVGYTHTFQD